MIQRLSDAVDQGFASSFVDELDWNNLAQRTENAKRGIENWILAASPDIFDILRNQPAGAGGEIQLADAINTQAAKDAVEAVTLNGRRFDCGSVQGYLDAIMHVADRRKRWSFSQSCSNPIVFIIYQAQLRRADYRCLFNRLRSLTNTFSHVFQT